MSDVTVQLVAPLKGRLTPGITAMVESEETLLWVQDKAAMLSLAAQVDIRVPRYTRESDQESLLQFAAEAGFPVVIKPCARGNF